MNSENFKYLAAIGIGSIAGLLIGRYLWGTNDGNNTTLSKHIKTLANVIEQLEDINTDEALDLKNRIHTILKSFEKPSTSQQ